MSDEDVRVVVSVTKHRRIKAIGINVQAACVSQSVVLPYSDVYKLMRSLFDCIPPRERARLLAAAKKEPPKA